MSENSDTSGNASEEANKDMLGLGVHFIDLEEITQPREEEEQAIKEREELKGRLNQAKKSYRQKKELYDRMVEHGLAHEELMNEIVAENKKLTSTVKELQQQLANNKKKMEQEEEEAQRPELLSEEERLRNQSTYIRRMEKENQKLRKQNENLSDELDQLSLREKYHDHLEKLRTTGKELKHKLDEIQEALDSKNDEIKRKFLTLVQKLNNIEALRQEQRELREQLRSAQEEQILAALSSIKEPLGEKRQPLDISATDEEDKEHQDGKTGSWWHRCAMILRKGVKVTGLITLCVLLSVGIMACVAPVCNNPDPDCNLWSIAFDVLEPYIELQYTHSPVY